MNEKKRPYGWIAAIIISGIFVGYRALTGFSLTRDMGRGVTSLLEMNDEPVGPRKASPQTVITDGSDGNAQSDRSSLTDLQEQLIGFLAQTACSTKKYNYTPEEVRRKIDYFIEVKDAESLRAWMAEPKVAGIASILSMAFNSSCTKIDIESDFAQRAFRMMDSL